MKDFLKENMAYIYGIFFVLTLLACKEAYYQRGYFSIGGEIMIMLVPCMIDAFIKINEEEEDR